MFFTRFVASRRQRTARPTFVPADQLRNRILVLIMRPALYMKSVLYFLLAGTALAEEAPRPVDGIMDNSFLVEEAYNQEPGVVQHIFNGVYGRGQLFGPDRNSADFTFTQEWPIFSQTHQFSYTLPYSFFWSGSDSANGFGDVLLNYRYQAYLNEKTLTGFAPRFSLALPTGEYRKGFANNTFGYQWNLPFSTTLNDRWFVHANAGLTYLPEMGDVTPRDLLNFNLGASTIYCVNGRFNLMLEWIGNWVEVPLGDGTERHFLSVISPGMRYAFNFKSGAQLVVGLAAPIGLTSGSPDLGAFLYLSFEHRFLEAEKK